MILLLTSESGDLSHIEIVNWLEYFRADYMIITGESFLRGDVNFVYKDDVIICNGRNLTKEVSVVFYRRWLYPSNVVLTKDSLLNKTLLRNLYNETLEVCDFLSSHLKNAIWIPSYQSVCVNKLAVLNYANKVGLLIPKTIVTTSKKELLSFVKKCKNGCITKAIGNYTNIKSDKGLWAKPIYTKEVDTDFITNKCPSQFSISLFQENIPKCLELRIFYFMGVFYTVSIISQNSSLTSTDSRISKEDDFSTIAPYNLDSRICDKLRNLFSLLKLNTGSVDMVLTPENKYVFLEINPVGQFGGYSRRAGLNIEKEIVKKLIKFDYSHERNNKQSGS